jgi:hypothetical protein
MFADAFYITERKKEEGTVGLQFTFGLFISALNTESLGEVLLPAHTAGPNSQLMPAHLPTLHIGNSDNQPSNKWVCLL